MVKRKNAKTSARWLKARMRARQALNLRLKGYSYAEIAVQLDYANPSVPYNAVQRILRYHEMDAVDELRQVEGARLDKLMAGVWTAAVSGNLDAVDSVLKIQQRRAKLLGLDLPVEVHLHGEIEVKHMLLLKVGDRPPRAIDMANVNWDSLSDEELQIIKEMPPMIEGEVKEVK